MRKHKFRAWFQSIQEGSNGVMLYTCFPFKPFKKDKNTKGNVIEWDEFWNKVKNYTGKVYIMEYTGVNDNDGNEIYEGDIIKDYFNVIALVKFHKGAFYLDGYYYDLDGWFVDELCLINIKEKEIKVIGNMYENPELFKEWENRPRGL